MLAVTWPLRPIVTRLSGRLIFPSNVPSTSSGSVPVISPVIIKPLPMHDGALGAGAGWAVDRKAGTVREDSGAWLVEDVSIGLDFHIVLIMTPFLSWGTVTPRQGMFRRPESETFDLVLRQSADHWLSLGPHPWKDSSRDFFLRNGELP
jgi:hypothetical protein